MKTRVITLILSSSLSVGMCQTFQKINNTVTPLTNAISQWVDFNNDGLYDLFTSGVTVNGTPKTAVYFNDGNASFTTLNLPSLTDAAADFADYDNDGLIDIVMIGVDAFGMKQAYLLRNVNGIAFNKIDGLFEKLSNGSALARDFDNDGDIDVLLTGVDNLNVPRTVVYKNSLGIFSTIQSSVENVSNGQCRLIDVDNDGVKEVLITGMNANGVAVTKTYSSDENLNFTFYNELSGFAFNDIAVSDVTDDGFSDILMTGLEFPDFTKKSILLQNNGINSFLSVDIPTMPNVALSSARTGDIDNDGRMDFILSGQDDNDVKHFHYLRNGGNSVFSDVANNMSTLYNGSSSLADFDNDGDLDVFQLGNSDIMLQANLFQSGQSSVVANAAPSVPQNLKATTDKDQVILSWTKSIDDHTTQASLTYNLYISKKPGGQDFLLSPMADIATGLLRAPLEGNSGYVDFKTMHRLAEGKYYWSVQSIDNGFVASQFAPEQFFTVCYGEDLGADLEICDGDTVQLSAGKITDVVNWYSLGNGPISLSSNSISYIVKSDASIVVEVTRNFGCTIRDTVKVSQLPLPTINLGSDIQICWDKIFSKTVNGNYSVVNWYSDSSLSGANSFSFSFRAKTDDIIVAEVFDPRGCRNSDTLKVNVLSLPTFSAGPDLSICEGSIANLSIQGQWSSVRWLELVDQHMANGATFSFPVLHDAFVITTVIDGSGCSNSDTLNIKRLSLPTVDLGLDQQICYGDELSLTSSNSGQDQITWVNKSGELLGNLDTLRRVITTDEVFILKIINSNFCEDSDTINASVLPLPYFSLGSDTSICYGKNLLLKTPNNLKRIDWILDGQVAKMDSWFFDHKVYQTSVVSARVEDFFGCTYIDTVKISMLPLPQISLGSDQHICRRDSVIIGVTGNWPKVNWYDGQNIIVAQNASDVTLPVVSDFSLRAEVFSLQGCVSNDTVNVFANQLPSFDLGDDRVSCHGDRVDIFCGISALKYIWNNSQGRLLSEDRSLIFNATSSDVYTLTVEDANTCTFTDSIEVVVNPLPVIVIEGDSIICEGKSIALEAISNGIASAVWRNSSEMIISNSAQLEYLPALSDSVSITVIDINSCLSVRVVPIDVLSPPELQLAKDTLICFGERLYLEGRFTHRDNLVFDWSPKESLDDYKLFRPLANPTMSTTYIVDISDGLGCHSYDSIRVEVNPEIRVDAGSDGSVCAGQSVRLGGSPTATGSIFPYQYSWTSAASVFQSSDSNPTLVPTSSDLFHVFVTTGRCSVVYDSIYVTVNSPPIITASTTQSIGEQQSVQLYAAGGVKYIWSPSESLDDFNSLSPVARPSRTTLYHVIGEDQHGCKGEADALVLVQNSVFIPNLFTPNGDGTNDYFKVYGSGISNIRLSIFDLEGNEVFSSNDDAVVTGSGWDGTFAGKPLPSNSYIWVIDGLFGNGSPVTHNGTTRGAIKLMR